jgi:predicted nuclease with TOPRIM domain
MADEPDNLIIAMLRRIDANVAEMRQDIRDLQVRMTHVEEGLAGVNRRLDRLDLRVDRIERRLELSDAPR